MGLRWNAAGSLVYDPNIKVAVPEGYGEEHFIGFGQRIQYTIPLSECGRRYGTPSPFGTSFPSAEPGKPDPEPTSSHAHEWIISAGPDHSITFPGINLPDSTSNEAESYGFFSYHWAGKGILPYTRIENKLLSISISTRPSSPTQRSAPHQKPRVAEAIFTRCPGDLSGKSGERDPQAVVCHTGAG